MGLYINITPTHHQLITIYLYVSQSAGWNGGRAAAGNLLLSCTTPEGEDQSRAFRFGLAGQKVRNICDFKNWYRDHV